MQTIDEVRLVVEEVGLGHLWADVESLLRPGIRLNYDITRAPETLPVGTSRMGGWPDLPVGAEWPMWAGNHWDLANPPAPMLFLAQINLADVAALEIDSPLPKSGMLYFFACVWIEAIGMYGMDKLAAVCYFDGDLIMLRPNVAAPPFPKEVNLEQSSAWYPDQNGVGGYHYKPVGLRFDQQWTVPSPYNGLPAHYINKCLRNDYWNEYSSLRNRLDTDARSHPFHQMLGWATGDSKHALGAETYDKHTLLLQMDSNWLIWEENRNSPSDFDWQFSGCGWFYMEPEALRRRDFDAVEFYWATT